MGCSGCPHLSVDVGAFVTLCPDLLSALGKAYSSELPVLTERMHCVSSPVSRPLAVSSCPVSGVVGTDPFSSSIRQPGSQPGGDPSLLPSLLPPPFCHSQPDHPCSWSCLQRSGGKRGLCFSLFRVSPGLGGRNNPIHPSFHPSLISIDLLPHPVLPDSKLHLPIYLPVHPSIHPAYCCCC